MKLTKIQHFGGIVLLLSLAGAQALFGQTSSSTISGTVSDTSGAAVVGAAVAVKNIDTGVTANLTTDAEGRYRAPEIVLGNYEVRATHPGFETVVRSGISTAVGEEAIVDISLPVGQASQVVTVDSVVTQVDTSTSALSVTFDQQQMSDLPMGTARNFVDLINLAPGVAAIQNGNGGVAYGQQANYTVSGSRPTGLGFLIDSTNFTTFNGKSAGSGATGFSPGIEALSQFQVLTNTYSAQFGGNGIVVNAASKSGTNSMHGSAYIFVGNSFFSARGEFDTVVNPGQTAAHVPPSHTGVLGGSVGGPIKKNKLFYFVNYEATRQGGETTQQNTNVPDANAHAGYLPCAVANGTATAPTKGGGKGGTTTGTATYPCDNNTGLAYVGFAPAIQPLMNLLPTAQTSVSLGQGIQTQLNPTGAHDNYTLGRVDYTISDRDTIFMRMVHENAYRLITQGVGVYTEKDATSNWYATVEERHTISPSMINLARISLLRPQEIAVENTPSIPALHLIPGSIADASVIVPSGNRILGPNQNTPFNLTQDGFQLMDDVIWSRGAHNVKFGVGTTYTKDYTFEVSGAPGGQLTFNSILTFMQGLPAQLQAPLPGQSYNNRDMSERTLTPYIHDEWKFSRRLTLNIGLRYEWAANPSEYRNNFWNFPQPLTNTTWVNIPKAFANNPTNKNFAPRFGFAYDPFNDHKTSVRGGFGIFYDVMTGHIILPAYWGAYPYAQGTVTSPPWPNPYSSFQGATSVSAPSLGAGVLYGNGKTSTPYAMQYNLNIQREVYKGAILQVAYVGSRGVHLLQTIETNPPQIINGVFGTLNTTNGTTTPNPRINPNLGSLAMRAPIGSSHYNALQVNLTRRFASHFSANVSYAYSKSIDYGSAFSQDSSVSSNTLTLDPYNTKIDRGLSTFDRTHVLRTNIVYELPFSQNQFVKGWRLTGIYSQSTGAPTTITTGFERTGLGGNSGGANRPDLAPGCSPNPIIGTIQEWFDISCFTLQAVGTIGNLGRTTVIGPPAKTMNFGILKDTRIPKISEFFDLQFRAEATNLFNHPNLDLHGNGGTNATMLFQNGGTVLPNGTITAPTLNPIAGQILSQFGSGRTLTFALKVIF